MEYLRYPTTKKLYYSSSYKSLSGNSTSFRQSLRQAPAFLTLQTVVVFVIACLWRLKERIHHRYQVWHQHYPNQQTLMVWSCHCKTTRIIIVLILKIITRLASPQFLKDYITFGSAASLARSRLEMSDESPFATQNLLLLFGGFRVYTCAFRK